MRSRNNYNSHYQNYQGRSNRNRTEGSSGHTNWDWDKKYRQEEDPTRNRYQNSRYDDRDDDYYSRSNYGRTSSRYGNEDFDTHGNSNYGSHQRYNDNYGSRHRQNGNYGNSNRRNGNYGRNSGYPQANFGDYRGGSGRDSRYQQEESRYGNYRGPSYRNSGRYDDDNFVERAGRKIRNAWNDMTDRNTDQYGRGTNQRAYGRNNNRNNDRNFFERAGDRIRQTWVGSPGTELEFAL